MTAPGQTKTTFKFVSYSDPKDVQSGKVRKQVRSHVSKWQHSQTRAKLREAAQSTDTITDADVDKNTGQGRKESEVNPAIAQKLTGIPVEQWSSLALDNCHSRQADSDTRGNNSTTENSYDQDAETTLISPEAYKLVGNDLTKAFSQGAMSFKTIALQDSNNIIGLSLKEMHLDLSSVMGLYKNICMMQAVDFARQYDIAGHQGSWGRFYAFVYTDPILLSTAVLLGVRNQLDVLGRCLDRQTFASVMQIERFLMRSINEALGDPVRGVSDQMLITVGLCAAYEIKHGTGACYHVHMQGLVQMIQLRGGLAAIGQLDSYVSRLLVWLDANTSKIAGCRPYLQDMVDGLTAHPKANTLVFRTKGNDT